MMSPVISVKKRHEQLL